MRTFSARCSLRREDRPQLFRVVRWKCLPTPTRSWPTARAHGVPMQELLAAARSMFSPPAAGLHGLPLPAGAAGSSQRRQPFTLMPLGDSITDGGTKLRSYRFHLHQSLARSGYEVEWLGSMLGVHDKLPDANTTTGRPVLDDREWPVAKQRHEGHWGWTAEQVLQGHKRQPQRGQLSKWLHPGKGVARAPQVVMLHLGTNDLSKHVVKKNGSVVVVARRIRGVMRRVCRANPRVLLLLASPIPYCRFPREDTVSLEHRQAVERDFGMHLSPCTPPDRLHPHRWLCSPPSVRCAAAGALHKEDAGLRARPRGLGQHDVRRELQDACRRRAPLGSRSARDGACVAQGTRECDSRPRNSAPHGTGTQSQWTGGTSAQTRRCFQTSPGGEGGRLKIIVIVITLNIPASCSSLALSDPPTPLLVRGFQMLLTLAKRPSLNIY